MSLGTGLYPGETNSGNCISFCDYVTSHLHKTANLRHTAVKVVYLFTVDLVQILPLKQLMPVQMK